MRSRFVLLLALGLAGCASLEAPPHVRSGLVYRYRPDVPVAPADWQACDYDADRLVINWMNTAAGAWGGAAIAAAPLAVATPVVAGTAAAQVAAESNAGRHANWEYEGLVRNCLRAKGYPVAPVGPEPPYYVPGLGSP